ncbi:MAG TPA: 50S ribosomal protein L35 [Candidatus Dormibacteraeota bacterium]|nr:50S ribosomal protein L35 [Candidatus Dormibacteraeota bacterium]
MPKIKTQKGIAKRIRVTRNGKLVRRHSWMSHRLHQKSKKHKRKDHTEQPVAKADSKAVRRALGV